MSICSPSLFLDFEWQVHDDLCGSDHFPTFLNATNRPDPTGVPKWNLKKADWSEFRTFCESQLTPETLVGMKYEEETVTSILHTIAEKTIPKTSAVPRKLNKPWWTEECQEVYNNRKKALNNVKKHPTTEKLNIYKREHARARTVFRESMKNSWKNHVSKLNDRNPINKTWDMITGKGQSNGTIQF